MVTPEVIGIHGDGADRPGNAKPDDAPIVIPRPAAAPGLPTVHPLAPIGVLALDEHPAPGLEQVLLGREKLVAREERPAADARRGEVDQAGPHHRTHLPLAPTGKS